MRYTVHIRGLDIYAYHGVPAAERSIGHRYHVDAELEVEGTAPVTDDVQDTVDYGHAACIIRDQVLDRQDRTLERLAAACLEALFDEFDGLMSAQITIEKPMPPAPFIADAAGITLVMERGDDEDGDYEDDDDDQEDEDEEDEKIDVEPVAVEAVPEAVEKKRKKKADED